MSLCDVAISVAPARKRSRLVLNRRFQWATQANILYLRAGLVRQRPDILFYFSVILSRIKKVTPACKHWNTTINSTLREIYSKQFCWLSNVSLLSKGLSKWLAQSKKYKQKRNIAFLCDYVTRSLRLSGFCCTCLDVAYSYRIFHLCFHTDYRWTPLFWTLRGNEK